MTFTRERCLDPGCPWPVGTVLMDPDTGMPAIHETPGGWSPVGQGFGWSFEHLVAKFPNLVLMAPDFDAKITQSEQSFPDQSEPVRTVAGHCPMGCGETLALRTDGQITCGAASCERPTAAHELLADAETRHVVELAEDGFTLRHPLRERLDDALLDCTVHRELTLYRELSDPSDAGRWRITTDTEPWRWERFPPQAVDHEEKD